MVPLMAEKESRRPRVGIAGKWMISSFGVVLVILLFVIAAAGVMLHSYYYGAARQILLARSGLPLQHDGAVRRRQPHRQL